MADSSPLELAALEDSQGVRPGMPRAEVIAAMKQRGIETAPSGNNNLTATTDAWELEFSFADDGTERLRQIAIDGEEILWNGQPLVGVRLDGAWRTIGSPANAVWEANDAIADPFPEMDGELLSPRSDEELIEEGTVWLPDRGLGFAVCEGEVYGVVWRATVDLPQHYSGPLTPAQRELSKRPDLEDHLRAKRAERYKLAVKKDPLSPVRTLVTIATIAALAWVGKLGFDESLVWNQAETLQAKFIAEEQVPMKQFRDYLPPALRWVVPPSRPVIVDAYRVEYIAPKTEAIGQVVLERGELYVPPQNPGDEVPVAYVAGDPPRVKGFSRARDSAFVEYVPWAIATGALWLLVHFALSFLPSVLPFAPKIIQRFAPSSVVKDPNRPELR